MIKLDESSTSVLVTCEGCPWWFAFAFTYDDAETRACRHEENVHPEHNDMRRRAATRARVRRHRSSV